MVVSAVKEAMKQGRVHSFFLRRTTVQNLGQL